MAKKNTSTESATKPEAKKGRPKATAKKKIEAEPNKSEESIHEKIYGSTEVKIEVLDFPITDFQTQTKNIIKEYGIETCYLPQEIGTAINSMITDFTYFVQNPQNYGMVSVIMDKDLVATNLLKGWIEPRKDLLLQVKKHEVEEVKTLPAVTKDNWVQSAQPQTVVNPHSVHTNTFHPRTPENNYVHTFGIPPSSMENKDVHYQVLAQADSSIKAQNHAHQNWQGEVSEAPFVIDREKIFHDYCLSIESVIKGCFQNIHWGFVPESDVRVIISQLDQSYQYNLVVNGTQSYIEVNNGTASKKTDFFTIQ